MNLWTARPALDEPGSASIASHQLRASTPWTSNKNIHGDAAEALGAPVMEGDKIDCASSSGHAVVSPAFLSATSAVAAAMGPHAPSTATPPAATSPGSHLAGSPARGQASSLVEETEEYCSEVSSSAGALGLQVAGKNETPPYNYLDFFELRCGGLAPQAPHTLTDCKILFKVL